MDLPYYKSRVACEVENVESEICYCPAGYTGYLCGTSSFNKCYVNITEPALHKGCKDKEDSDYYVYSIQGFDPCFFFDFTKSYKMKYNLQCRPVDEKGVVLPNGHPEGLGYKYSDITIYPNSGLKEGEMLYNYKSFNNKTKLRLLDDTNMTVTFDFRDFKYLSQIERFEQIVNDTDIVVGNKDGELDIDFNKMTLRDQNNGSQFEVGGRMYFEVHCFR